MSSEPVVDGRVEMNGTVMPLSKEPDFSTRTPRTQGNGLRQFAPGLDLDLDAPEVALCQGRPVRPCRSPCPTRREASGHLAR